MSRMNDLSIKKLEDAMEATIGLRDYMPGRRFGLGVYTPDLYPPAYDREVDPDPRLLELETQVARLSAERDRYGQHSLGCSGQDATGCECGWWQARQGTLWEHVGDSEDIQQEIESHWD